MKNVRRNVCLFISRRHDPMKKEGETKLGKFRKDTRSLNRIRNWNPDVIIHCWKSANRKESHFCSPNIIEFDDGTRKEYECAVQIRSLKNDYLYRTLLALTFSGYLIALETHRNVNYEGISMKKNDSSWSNFDRWVRYLNILNDREMKTFHCVAYYFSW